MLKLWKQRQRHEGKLDADGETKQHRRCFRKRAEASDEAVRESGVFTGPGGGAGKTGEGGRGSGLAHLFKQPQLSRGNENFHLCRAAQIQHPKSPLTSTLAQPLSSVSTAGAPGPLPLPSLPQPICTSRPPCRIQILSVTQVENWKS